MSCQDIVIVIALFFLLQSYFWEYDSIVESLIDVRKVSRPHVICYSHNHNNDDMIKIVNKYRDINVRIILNWIWNNKKFTINNMRIFKRYDITPRYFQIPLEADDYKQFDITERDYLFIHQKSSSGLIVRLYIAIVMTKNPFYYVHKKFSIYDSNKDNIVPNSYIYSRIHEKTKKLINLMINEATESPFFDKGACQDNIDMITYQIFSIDFVIRKKEPYIININHFSGNDDLPQDRIVRELSDNIINFLIMP